MTGGDRLAFLRRPYAHRGLHGEGVPENSRAAFRLAMDEGYAIELDVQASADGEAFVFHDADLDRMTGDAGLVRSREADSLIGVPLRDSNETIPRLAEVLGLVGGCVPLMIELKTPTADAETICEATSRALSDYAGEVAVAGFSPEVGRWFATRHAHVPRGLIVTTRSKRFWQGAAVRGMALRRSLAEFVAFDVRDMPSAWATRVRRSGRPLLAWTVRTPEQAALAASRSDALLFEAIRP